MIVVTAASGALGRLVVEELLTRFPDRPVAAAVRDPGRCADLTARGVDVRHADYDSPDTLRAALRGADRLLLISSPVMDTEHRTRQHLAAVAAAVDSGVRAVAYTSFLGADAPAAALGPNAAHHTTERALVDSGLAYTILRHPFYTDAFVNGDTLRAAVASGTLVSGTGGRGLNTALRSDLAAAAATVLTDDARTALRPRSGGRHGTDRRRPPRQRLRPDRSTVDVSRARGDPERSHRPPGLPRRRPRRRTDGLSDEPRQGRNAGTADPGPGTAPRPPADSPAAGRDRCPRLMRRGGARHSAQGILGH
ncbi:NAD(P)H-binding protein [Dactylosporangium sp. NBC_01737]|uniref:NAD(P)H-binding protein n=1 Tax=Dactylosporangium sp. NBC_01737 TaxID=2975959 RepID=UPI002E117D4F|nr:NAD(P)H-binding protein [Dactylosporangium sp. NBC_01737]